MAANPVTTTTSELRALVVGRKNVHVTMMVAEVAEPRTFPAKQEGKKPVRLLAVRLINDEEEPVKLLVWGDQVPDMWNSLKKGALYQFGGLNVNKVYNPRFGFGHLGVELVYRVESQVDMVRPVYHIRGLPLVHEADIDPSSSWRIRVRAAVERPFSRYYQGDTSLSGDVVVGRSLRMQVVLHNVPMTYINAFTVGTEVEMKGHISLTGQLVDFDAQWEDVCNVPELKRNVWVDSEDQGLSRQPTAEPDTPTGTSMHAFYNSPAVSSSSSGGGRDGYQENRLLPSRSGASDNSRSVVLHNWTSSSSVANVGSVNNNANVAAKPFGIAVPKRHEFAATLNYPFAFNDLVGIYTTNAMLVDRKPPVPLRIQSHSIPEQVLEMLVSGTRVVVRGLVDLERRTLVMTADPDGGVLPEGYTIDPVLDCSLAADISGVDNKLHRVAAKIVEGFASVDGTNDYSGSILVEDDELVVITLTIRGVPDEKAHLLCKSAMIEATGVVTGNDFVMEMSCNWATDIVIRGEALTQRSPTKSPPPSESSSEIVLSREQTTGDKNVDYSSDSDAEQVQYLGSVDKEGQDQVAQKAAARPIKQEDFEAFEQYSMAGQNAGNSIAALQETPKSRSSSSAGGERQSRKRRTNLRQDPKKSTRLSVNDFILS